MKSQKIYNPKKWRLMSITGHPALSLDITIILSSFLLAEVISTIPIIKILLVLSRSKYTSDEAQVFCHIITAHFAGIYCQGDDEI